MYVDMRANGDSIGDEQIMEGGVMGARIGTKKFFCGYEVEKKEVFAFTDKTWLTEERKK